MSAGTSVQAGQTFASANKPHHLAESNANCYVCHTAPSVALDSIARQEDTQDFLDGNPMAPAPGVAPAAQLALW
jgi:hypothetical protein